MFNLRSWVTVLDFFGVGREQPVEAKDLKRGGHQTNTPTKSRWATATSAPSSSDLSANQRFDSEFDVKVKSLSLILNRPEYEVASITAKNYTSKVTLRDRNFAICGSLGNLSLKDLTANGLLYKDRFVSRSGYKFFPHLLSSFSVLNAHSETLYGLKLVHSALKH